MNVEIHSQGFPLTVALENHVRRRLRYVLSRHGDSIETISIDLRTSFSAAAGYRSSCFIRGELFDWPLPAIIEQGTDIYIVADRCVDGFGRLVTQLLHPRLRHADSATAPLNQPVDMWGRRSPTATSTAHFADAGTVRRRPHPTNRPD